MTDSTIADTIVELNRASVDDETSTSSLNMLSNLDHKEVLIQEQHIEDSSSPHSSLSSSDAGECYSISMTKTTTTTTTEYSTMFSCVLHFANDNFAALVHQKRNKYADANWPADELDDLTNHGDEHQPHRTVIENNLFYNSSNSCNNVNNDVQSMDAIERRDFISEQEANGNCLLGTSSLIINGTEPRLNLDILGNTFPQQMEQFSASSSLVDESSNKRAADVINGGDESVERTVGDQLISTTPTTSRTKRSRLNFASDNSEPSSLVQSIEKCSQLENVSTDRMDVEMHCSASTSSDNKSTKRSDESSKSDCPSARGSTRSLRDERVDNDGDDERDEADEEVKQIIG